MRNFNEDTRVKIPATLQFLRLGYQYQSMNDSDIDFNTKIFINRFKPALEKINGRSFSNGEVRNVLDEIHTLIRSNDLGREFYKRLNDVVSDVKLIDFDNVLNNDFAVVDELPFAIEKDTDDGSFRPDINILINGMPIAFLEVKKPNNEGTIQAEFNRMLNVRLKNPAYRKYFNLIQFVSFSNNMNYENDDSEATELVKSGSFYTTPNGVKTSFSFFREDKKGYHKNYQYLTLDDDFCRSVIKDLGYSTSIFDTDEFNTANDTDMPCNRFITSMYDKERFLYLLYYGILYVKGEVPEKHIMRYPQFFATRAILKRLKAGNKRGMGYEFTTENIQTYLNDVAGVRIVCAFIDDIYMISDLITQQDDIKVIEIKDYIKNPKSNGYRSYHMIVEIPVFFAKGKTPMRVELQIRTNGMDFWATLEHQLRYKKGIEEMPGYDEISEELLHSARAIIEADNEMQRIKDKIGMFHEI